MHQWGHQWAVLCGKVNIRTHTFKALGCCSPLAEVNCSAVNVLGVQDLNNVCDVSSKESASVGIGG